jgi:hypothetical protein
MKKPRLVRGFFLAKPGADPGFGVHFFPRKQGQNRFLFGMTAAILKR